MRKKKLLVKRKINLLNGFGLTNPINVHLFFHRVILTISLNRVDSLI